MKTSHLALALSLLALPAFACGAAGDDSNDGAESADSELRALSSAEVVGTISYGETKTVAYTSKPTYRALSFQAQKGDVVDVRFVSAGIDPVGYLLSPTFSTLARNDDEGAGSTASHINHTVSKAGTYYLAVKSAKAGAGDVTISLLRAGGAAPAPGSSSDPFDAASCSGAAVTSSKLMAMLDPSRGVLSKKVGRFTVHRRDRACYPGLACSDWRAGSREITAPFATLNATFTTDAEPSNYQLSLDGDVSVSYVGNALRLSLDGDLHSSSWGGINTPDYLSEALNVDVLSPTAASSTANVIVKYTWSPSLGCPNGHCQGNESVPGTSTASWAGRSPLTVTGNVTSSCMRFAATAAEQVTDSNGNAYRLESDLVLSGNFASATCHATTCAEQGSTCGSIPDGCGGTLECGSCGSGKTCQTPAAGSTTANFCRDMTPYESCAQSGRVYCPGYGCYDACG